MQRQRSGASLTWPKRSLTYPRRWWSRSCTPKKESTQKVTVEGCSGFGWRGWLSQVVAVFWSLQVYSLSKIRICHSISLIVESIIWAFPSSPNVQYWTTRVGSSPAWCMDRPDWGGKVNFSTAPNNVGTWNIQKPWWWPASFCPEASWPWRGLNRIHSRYRLIPEKPVALTPQNPQVEYHHLAGHLFPHQAMALWRNRLN